MITRLAMRLSEVGVQAPCSNAFTCLADTSLSDSRIPAEMLEHSALILRPSSLPIQKGCWRQPDSTFATVSSFFRMLNGVSVHVVDRSSYQRQLAAFSPLPTLVLIVRCVPLLSERRRNAIPNWQGSGEQVVLL